MCACVITKADIFAYMALLICLRKLPTVFISILRLIKINSVCIDCLFTYAKFVQIKCVAGAFFPIKSIMFAFRAGGKTNQNCRLFEI